ncbi:hypothetical protein B0H11DRAFT_2096058 [Mycena galericulata]|nr:hypothetical protein B0H11DRAFT_2096058 [Mycena galericulata]
MAPGNPYKTLAWIKISPPTSTQSIATMRFSAVICLVVAALSSVAVARAADDTALLFVRGCPAACAVNCPDVSVS